MAKTIEVDPDVELVVPRELFPFFGRFTNWMRRMEWVLRWLADKPHERKTFVRLANLLNDDGFKCFKHYLLTRNAKNPASGSDPLHAMRSALKFQKRKGRICHMKQKANKEGHYTSMLSNGSACRIWFDKESLNLNWFAVAEIEHQGAKITIHINEDQVFTLVDRASKNVKILKRVKTERMEYEAAGRTWIVAKQNQRAVLTAIAENTSVEAAKLLC